MNLHRSLLSLPFVSFQMVAKRCVPSFVLLLLSFFRDSASPLYYYYYYFIFLRFSSSCVSHALNKPYQSLFHIKFIMFLLTPYQLSHGSGCLEWDGFLQDAALDFSGC